MNLNYIRLSNFQSFGEKPTKITFEDITYLIEPNRAGKTAALQALCMLFAFDPSKRRILKSDFHVAFKDFLYMKMKNVFFAFVLFLLLVSPCFSKPYFTVYKDILITQEEINVPREYSFNLFDGFAPNYTMQQFMDNYISAYRLTIRALDDTFYEDYTKTKRIKILTNPGWILKSFSLTFLVPLTHEEGHRAILTAQGIGSISQPFPNEHLACYVRGVTDDTLKNLRDTNLPVFIRMHTAGLESDYQIVRKETEMLAFKQESYSTIFFEMMFRSLGHIWYLKDGLSANDINLTEETDELDRDIVGHDVYGMAFHLFRPADTYSRYKSFEDLSDEEIAFVKRIGWKSLLNFANPLLWGVQALNITDNLYVNISAGASIAPFGDFIDENIYVTYKDVHLTAYARQYQNRENWFPAFGAALVDFKPLNWLSITARGHFWMQPENLDFNTANAEIGGAAELKLTGYLPMRNPNSFMKVQAVGLSVGCLYKTQGFMPGIEQHDEHLRISTNIAFRY